MNNTETEQLADQLGIETVAGRRALAVAIGNIRVLDSKQQDYGPRNIADFGAAGVLVRANDKIQRLRNLLERGAEAKHEAVADSWLDLANYGIIGFLCETGQWPEREAESAQPSDGGSASSENAVIEFGVSDVKCIRTRIRILHHENLNHIYFRARVTNLGVKVQTYIETALLPDDTTDEEGLSRLAEEVMVLCRDAAGDDPFVVHAPANLPIPAPFRA